MTTGSQQARTNHGDAVERNPRGVVLLGAVAVATTAVYVWWRLFHTLDANRWLSVPLFVAELVVITRFLFSLASIGPAPGRGVVAPSGVVQPDRQAPVEVLVVAVDGDREALSRTLALTSVENPMAVRVLDSFVRPELAEEARRHGASYEVLGSPRPAELVGRAMTSSEAPYVAWLDAGDVPVPGMLGLAEAFRDPSVAVVQSAADLVNRDSLLHLTPDHDERAVANRVAGPSLDRAGSAQWEGSGSLVRVSAIEYVGGLHGGHGSATHRTALRLRRAGMQVRFCAEPMVRTGAPDTLSEYLAIEEGTSRADWALLATSDTPLRPRAGFRATLAQLHRSTTALDGLARLTFLAVLAAVLLGGELPFSVGPLAMAAAFAVPFVLRTATLHVLGRGTIGFGDPTRQAMRLMGARISALVRSAPDVGGGESRRWAALGQLPLLTASLVVLDVALVLRLLTLVWPGLLPPMAASARFVAMAATVWAVLVALDVLHVLVSRVQRRAHHRQGTELLVDVDGRSCRSVDLTPVGVGLLVPAALLSSEGGAVEPGASVPIHFEIPRLDGSRTPVDLRAHIEHLSQRSSNGLHRAGAAFVGVPPDARDALVEFCALTAEHRDRAPRPVAESAPDDYDVATHGAGRRALAMLSTIGLIVAGPFVALGPSAGAAEADPRDAVVIGYVRDQNGTAVEGACVGIWDDGRVPWVNTDANGRYELTSVSAGQHSVVTQDCSGSGHMATFAPSTPWAQQAQAVDVGASEQVEGVDIVVVPGVDVTGRVVDESGDPAGDVCVNYGPFDSEPGSEQMWLGYSGEDGRLWGRLPAGQVVRIQMNDCSNEQRFSTSWYPGTTAADKAEAVKVPTVGEFDLGDAVMQSGAVVTGTVQDSRSQAVSSACVSAQEVLDGSWNWVGGTHSDDQGNYRFVVPPGTYALWFSDCDGEQDFLETWYPDVTEWTDNPPTVEVGPGENRFDMTVEPGAVVTGTVYDEEGTARADACVGVVSVHEHGWDWVAGTHTDKGGNYRILSPLGDYSLTANGCDDSSELVQGFQDGSPMWSEPAPTVSLAEGDNGPYDFSLELGANLDGVVRDAAGNPATGVCVTAIDAESARNDQWRSVGWARAADDGSWQTGAIPSGSYLVHYSNCDEDWNWSDSGTWIPEFHDGVLDPLVHDLAQLTSVDVVRGDTAPLEADLVRAARVKGRITSDGAPAGGVCVGSRLGEQETSNDDGYYSIGLLPGQEVLTFTDCETGRGLVQETHAFDLAEGDGVVLDLAMAQAEPATISGSVRTASGGVIQPSCVVAYVPDELIGMAMVDSNGDFEIPGLGAGAYWVGVFGCSEDAGMVMVDPDTGEQYSPSWFPGVAISFPEAGSPDPASDGATPFLLSPGSQADASFCFGGCTQEVPATTTTTTTTTAAPTTAAPTTAAPTTAVPTTAVPTTAAPTTAAPTTAAPTTVAPGAGSVAMPGAGSTLVPGIVPTSAPAGAGGPLPVVDSGTLKRYTPTIAGPAVASSVMTLEELAEAPYAVVSADNASASVQGPPESLSQAAYGADDEVAAAIPVQEGDPGSGGWLWAGAVLLLMAVAGGLIMAKRRLS
ncbi:MAG: glycosyltransferase [Microthrixaceae bacterium]|nr:glycosyltransferase [Microthrixaceae bacterium]